MAQITQDHIARAIAATVWIVTKGIEPTSIEQIQPPPIDGDRTFKPEADLTEKKLIIKLNDSGTVVSEADLSTGQGYITINGQGRFAIRWPGSSLDTDPISALGRAVRGRNDRDEVTLDEGFEQEYRFRITK